MMLEEMLDTELGGGGPTVVEDADEVGTKVLDSEPKVVLCDEHGRGPGTKVELTGKAPILELRIVAYESVVDRDDAAQVSFTSKEQLTETYH
jgi:hypothetical protein